jgi:outer membrane protein assembly factor BamB
MERVVFSLRLPGNPPAHSLRMIVMSLKNITILASGLLVCLGSPLMAQSGANGLVSPIEARRHGLEPSWFTRVELDQARGRIHNLRYFVSATNQRTLYEVAYGESRRVFSERDLDRFGEPMGPEGAERAANDFASQLKRLEIESEIQSHEVPEITLYVTTDRSLVQAIDAETGRTLWATTVGRRDFPTEGPGVNEEYVAVINGTSLYLLTRDTGQIVWVRTTRGVPAACPAVSDRFAIVPTWTGDIELYELEEPRKLPNMFKSNGRSMVRPTVTPNSIIWPTDRGMLYVASSQRHTIRFRLEAKDAITAPASVFAPNRIFTASVDGYVYCVAENVHSEIWRFSTGQSITTTPVPTGESLYVVTDDMNLYCLDQETGALKWVAPFFKRFIAASPDRIYGIGVTDRLEILDLNTGSRIASMNAGNLDVFYPNHQSDRIIVGTRTGILQSLHEIGRNIPALHVDLAERRPETTRADEPQEGDPATPAKPSPKPPGDTPDPFGDATDPFGDAADPFGDAADPSGDAADPSGGGQGQAADPFGDDAGGAADPFGGGDDPFR